VQSEAVAADKTVQQMLWGMGLGEGEREREVYRTAETGTA